METKTKNDLLIREYGRYLFPVLKFRPIVLTRGEGSYVWDADDNRYLDLNSGQYCAVLGHSNPGVAKLISKISKKLQDTDTGTISDEVLFAAKKMHDITPEMNSRVIFLSTGAEANECCLRYAKHIKEKNGVIAFDIGYHGLTHGTACYSMARARIRPPVELSFVTKAPLCYDDETLSRSELDRHIDDFKQIVKANAHNIAAAIFEPVISGGGLYFPPKYYFKAIKQICADHNVFLVFDECQTGMGRLGSWFYCQQLECIPDFIVCAKALGLGFPVSCVIANGHTVDNALFVMNHFSSHQNEPFAASIVSYAIDAITEMNLLEKNLTHGSALLDCLRDLSRQFDVVTHPRGRGLMCGFDLKCPDGVYSLDFGNLFCRRALEFGLFLQHCNYGKTVRILPNYVIEQSEIDTFAKKMELLLATYYGEKTK